MDPSEPTSTIDDLLARYLLLVDEYTTLRADLSRLQSATFQHLARANFAAERGTRYGADQYDERMQASRTVVFGGHDMRDADVSADGDGKNGMVNVGSSGGTGVEFRVVTKSGGKHGGDDEKEQKQHQQEEKQKSAEGAEAEADEDKRAKTSTTDTTENPQDIDTHSNKQQDKKDKPTSPPVPVDPLRWFGVLTPLALRQTQACAVEVVERIVPRLVMIDIVMREVEIEVRRAKKRRAKREAAAAASVPAPVATTKDIEAL